MQTKNTIITLTGSAKRTLPPSKEDHKKLQAFYRKMVKYEHCIFTFLHSHHVPPDNNASERAIRNVKVKLPAGRESLRTV